MGFNGGVLLDNLLAHLGLLVQGETESEHGVWISIVVHVVDGIQIESGHLVHYGYDK